MTNAKTITNETANQSPAAALWRIVVSELELASAQFERNWRAVEAAEKEVRESEQFRRVVEIEHTYGIRGNMRPEEVLEQIDTAIQHRDHPESCAHCGHGDELSDDEIDRMSDEAEAIHAELRRLKTTVDALRCRCIEPARDEHFRYAEEVYNPARVKLFATPAPDLKAALYKAEVLAGMIDEAEGLRDDLNRLLSEAA